MALSALNMQSADLAELTGLHKNTIWKANKGKASKQTYAVIELVFREKGVLFGVSDDGREWVAVEVEEDAE